MRMLVLAVVVLIGAGCAHRRTWATRVVPASSATTAPPVAAQETAAPSAGHDYGGPILATGLLGAFDATRGAVLLEEIGAMRTMILAVAVSTGALGCVGVGTSRARVPLKAQYDTSTRQAAIERALAYLSERNYPIRVVNEQVGLINTEWVSIGTLPCGLFGIAPKEAHEQIAITLGSSGQAIVNVNRQILDCYNFSYGWTDSDPDGAEAEQARILEALLGRPLARGE